MPLPDSDTPSPQATLPVSHGSSSQSVKNSQITLRTLAELERKVLWLSSWMIHHANHLREKTDGLKVGGHQASSASLATIMTVLYFDVLRPEDRVAVKPHASPVFHAIQYLLGNQTQENLEKFRSYRGAQSYPSRTKDADDVDFSTGSVGLGAAVTAFASLVQDYVQLKKLGGAENNPTGRMVALVGDAELDEGNIFEALYECWKHGLRNTWWVIDYNRQSLDAVVTDRLFGQIDDLFRMMGWRVVTLKYGRRLEEAFRKPGGTALREWIDECPNSLYSALVFKGGAVWRKRILADLGHKPRVQALLKEYADEALHQLMTNLAGHDLEVLHETFHSLEGEVPTCIIAYTIKGCNLPFAGHKDNHAGLMNPEQMEQFREQNNIHPGKEWERFAGLDLPEPQLEKFLAQVPFNQKGRRRFQAGQLPVPESLSVAFRKTASTQEGFGRMLADLARREEPLSDHIVTLSPDVTVSTNLGGWVNRRGVFDRQTAADPFREQEVASMQKWELSPSGQHIELGIAENNLFLMLAALGLSHDLFGARLLPIATLYDPFIYRGLDALNYACYQDARFILVATPSGITLAPEGGAHQSIGTPLVGMAQDGLATFEPAFVDELAVILGWAFDYIQRDGSKGDSSGWLRDASGGSVYLRLSTRPIAQPERTLSEEQRQAIITGGYWLKEPELGAELALVYTGAVAPEVQEAFAQIAEDIPGAGLLAVTSADRLNAGWQASRRARHQGKREGRSPIETLLAPLAPDATLVTILDGHPAALSWLGSVRGHRVESLGVEHFGQSGNLRDLYQHYGLDVETLLDACATACLNRLDRNAD